MSTTTPDPFAIPDPPGIPVPDSMVSAPEREPLPAYDAPAADDAPKKRPTTRAGRKAAAEAAKARRAAAPKPDSKPKTTKPTPRKASLETRLAANLAGLGGVMAVAGGMVSPAFANDGVLITQHSADVAKALAKVADDQPKVKQALETWLTAGVWSGLITALLPLMVGIAANHGMVPDHLSAMLGATVPEAPAGG